MQARSPEARPGGSCLLESNVIQGLLAVRRGPGYPSHMCTRASVLLSLIVSGCVVQLEEATDEAVIACLEAQDCPSGLVCAGGRCVSLTSPCVDATGADAVPVPDGNACSRSDGSAGVCVEGSCVEPRCGDGVASAGEECDDGDDGSENAPDRQTVTARRYAPPPAR